MEGPYSIQTESTNLDLRENLTVNSVESIDSVSQLHSYLGTELPTYLARV